MTVWLLCGVVVAGVYVLGELAGAHFRGRAQADDFEDLE